MTRGALASHAGGAKFAVRWGLRLVKARLEQASRIRERALIEGAPAREAEALARTVDVPWSLYWLRREWNRAKADVAPWWAENSKEACNSGLDALARALSAWPESRQGKRKGPKMGFPQVPRKRGGRCSFRVTTGSFGVTDDRHVRLPRIGIIRTKELTVKLARQLEARTARVLSATVSQKAGRWYVSFGCETGRTPADPLPLRGQVVGVDIDVSCLAVLSTGEMVPNPRHLSRYARRLARLQAQQSRRHGPGRHRNRPPERWCRTVARVARAHGKVAQARADGLCKLTTALANNHGTVVAEDLNVAGMTASARGSGHWRGKAVLNRAILDVAPAGLRRHLGYNCGWYGSALVTADRWYASSKTCSGCGWRKPSLPRSERTFRCDNAECGLVIDRDLNAALNLAALVSTVSGTASGAGTGQGSLACAQGEERFTGLPRCSPVNCEDGAGPRPGKTATVPSQGETAACAHESSLTCNGSAGAQSALGFRGRCWLLRGHRAFPGRRARLAAQGA